jgi:hypothetical protein
MGKTMELKYEYNLLLYRNGEFMGLSGWNSRQDCIAWMEKKKMLAPGGLWLEDWNEKPRF